MIERGYSGRFVIAPEEKAALDQELLGRFENSKSFKWVDLRQINVSKIPRNIVNIIEGLTGGAKTITSFFAIKTVDYIPLHRHDADGEVYFGGFNARVALHDTNKNFIGEFDLADDVFTVTHVGEWHGTDCGCGFHTFFGVKFV